MLQLHIRDEGDGEEDFSFLAEAHSTEYGFAGTLLTGAGHNNTTKTDAVADELASGDAIPKRAAVQQPTTTARIRTDEVVPFFQYILLSSYHAMYVFIVSIPARSSSWYPNAGGNGLWPCGERISFGSELW